MRYGLCKGSSDLIGWTQSGQFLAVEVKGPRGRATVEQLAFVEAVVRAGGVAGICRSVDEFRELVGGPLCESEEAG